ncbi:DeoR/GlpR family DNA-binding transcription regulator [Shouchella shacheensis]|uniref:DeoR/GlpR family DNA-binding transcription regulator n=1 Tax=Shouchella shacheensis TaxID=1649580 RepID=UPI00073FD681|nr:DeoR/GlpR family DNA-binding transcription regulator [Shouchella shacheensis]
MLTVERKERILALLRDQEVVKIQDIAVETGASESTIRRDLTELEQGNKLKRIHGGATLLQKKREELTVAEKTVKNRQEKQRIAKLAASFVEAGDCIFLDAGTTTFEMVPFLKEKDVVVVTNGLMNIERLLEAGIETHVIGGYVKAGTRAFVGRSAIENLETFRFDCAFLGTNGITAEDGCTTPDPDEAYIKANVAKRARRSYVMADHTKFGEVTFSKFADIADVTLVSSSYLPSEQTDHFRRLAAKTTIEVVENDLHGDAEPSR